MADPERTLEVLAGLREIGVATALDDFGAGHVSLGHLKQLDLDELKIDRSFVMRLADDERDAAIVHATVDLGRRLGMRVVAEGVETVGGVGHARRAAVRRGPGVFPGSPDDRDGARRLAARARRRPARRLSTIGPDGLNAQGSRTKIRSGGGDGDRARRALRRARRQHALQSFGGAQPMRTVTALAILVAAGALALARRGSGAVAVAAVGVVADRAARSSRSTPPSASCFVGVALVCLGRSVRGADVAALTGGADRRARAARLPLRRAGAAARAVLAADADGAADRARHARPERGPAGGQHGARGCSPAAAGRAGRCCGGSRPRRCSCRSRSPS